MSMRPSRNTSTSKSIAAYASRRGSTPSTTIATAPSRLAAGRLRCTNGRRWMAMRRYVAAKMSRPVVKPCPSIPHSAFRIPHYSYLPIGEQHTAARMGLRIALVGHPEVGPADAIAAGYEPAERVVEACLASHGHPPDAGAGRGGFGRRDRGIEAGRVAGRELEHAHFVLRPTLGERRRVPQDQRVQSVVAVDERRVAEAELRGQQDLASEVVARSEGRDEVAGRLERQAARRALAL